MDPVGPLGITIGIFIDRGVLAVPSPAEVFFSESFDRIAVGRRIG